MCKRRYRTIKEGDLVYVVVGDEERLAKVEQLESDSLVSVLLVTLGAEHPDTHCYVFKHGARDHERTADFNKQATDRGYPGTVEQLLQTATFARIATLIPRESISRRAIITDGFVNRFAVLSLTKVKHTAF